MRKVASYCVVMSICYSDVSISYADLAQRPGLSNAACYSATRSMDLCEWGSGGWVGGWVGVLFVGIGRALFCSLIGLFWRRGWCEEWARRG